MKAMNKQTSKENYLTNNAKYISNIWNKDHQQVDSKQQTQGNGGVTQPVEWLPWKEQLQKGTTDLKDNTDERIPKVIVY